MDKMLKLYKIVDGTEVAFPNDSEQLLLSSFDYSSQRMGNAPIITGTIMHGKCLDDYFNEIKPQEVFIVFNEERYYLKNTPTSSFSNTDARYKHDVEFVSERIKLSNVYFYDVVSSDVETDKPVSNSSVVTFSGNIREFAARLNYSLQYAKLQTVSDDGVVSGYNVVVDDDVSADEYKLVSFSNQYFEAVLQQTFELYGVPYYFKGKTIHFGWTDANSVINETLKYGKDNSLLSITKSNANNQIINRCTGTGSTDNISFYYPNNSELGELEYTLKDNKGNVLNDDFFVKNYNVLAKSVEVGTTYQYYDTTNYIDMEVLGAYFCKKEGDSPTTDWERISYGDDHVAFNTYINIKTYGGVVVPTFHHYRIDFKIKAEATVNLTFKAGVTTPTQDGSQFFFDLSDARFVRLFKGEYSPTNYAIRTLKTSGDNISFHLEEPDVYSLEVFDIDVTKIYPTLNNASYALEFFNVKNISAEDRTQEWRNEKGHTFRNLKKVGLTGDETKVPFGSTLSTKVLFRVAPQPNLMPYIYRESRGNERFYNAENNKYLDENNEYYEFANTYIESSPKEHIQQFEDIKPSIEGVVNNAGLPINVFTEFAYDENDNDEMDGENFKHPYFYGKLRKMDGKFGLNIFDYASEEGEMTISMIDGSCAACQFKIGVDSSTKKNIVQVDENGNLKRDANGDVIRFGSPQDVQNDTKNNEVWVALMKDKDTFNTLMPNATLKPSVGDKFVILHIELPREYVWAAEQKLTDAIIKHMAENNDEKFKFSIKFSRIYLAENPDVLKRLSENSTIRFEYNGVEYFYYVSSFSYRFKSDEALPEINVELSDTITADKNTFEKAFRQVNTNVVYMQQQTFREVAKTISATTIPSNEDSTNTGVTDFVNGVKVSGDLISDLIKSNDVVTSSDDKIYTSKTVDEKIKNALENASVSGDFLSKTKEDVAQKKIVFKEGVGIGNAVILWDEEQGGLHIQKFDGTPAGLWTDSYLSAKGANPNTGDNEDGATTLGGLRNVSADADRTYDVAKMLVLEAKSNLWSLKNLSELVGGLDEAELAEYLTKNNYAKKSDIPSLSGYATEQWVLGKGYLTEHQDLSAYAKKTDIPTIPTKISAFENDANYATTSDLDNRIDALVNGAPAAYDTLKEIADVLANNINSIDDILTALGTKVSKDDFNTAIANVNNSISALNTELIGKIDLKLDAVTFNELFEKVQLEDGTWAIKAKLGLFSDGFISAKGSNVGGTSSEGGAVALYQLNDVLADGTGVSGAQNGAVFVYDATIGKWKGVAQSEIVPNLTGYATESWVLSQGFLTQHQDLSDYAKLSDIPIIPTTDINKGVTAYGWGDHSKVGYLTSHQSLDGYVNEIATSGNGNAITSVTKDGKKITFTKGATYLTGITSKLVTDALGYTPYDVANFTKANIKSTLGISDWALASSKPSYTTKEVSEDTNLYFTNARAVAALKSITDGLQSDIDKKLDASVFSELFEKVTLEGGVTAIRAKYGLFTDYFLSAKGANTNGGGSSGGGLITSLYRYADLGKTFADTNNDTFNAYTINKINSDLGSRISVLEGKATNVSFTQSLTSGTQIGSISIDGVTKNIYAPTIPTSDINKGVTAYGWGNHATMGYITASASITGNAASASLIKPTTGTGVASSWVSLTSYTKVWSEAFNVSSLGSDTGDIALYLRSGVYTKNSAELCVAIDGDFYAQTGSKKVLHEGNYTDYAYSKTTIDSKFSGLGTFAYKSSLAFSDLTGKPTTIGGFGITDAYTKSQVDSALGGYLPLSGGTIDGTNDAPLTINTTFNTSSIYFQKSGSNKAQIGWDNGLGAFLANSSKGYAICVRDDGTPAFFNSKYNTLIHSGNYTDYTYSKSTIDTKLGEYQPLATAINKDNIVNQIVDGITTHVSSQIDANGDISNLNSYYNSTGFRISRFTGLSGLGTQNVDGLIVNWPLDHRYGQQWYIDDETHTIQVRYVANAVWRDWKTIAFTDSNVASATKLQTARSLWGQSFNGENDVNGHLSIGTIMRQVYANRAELSIVSETDVPCDLWLGNSGGNVWSINCRPSNENHSFSIYHGSLGHLFRIDGASGNVGIGTTSPQYNLHVKSVAPALMCESTASESSIYFSASSENAYRWAIGKGVWNIGGDFGIGEYNTAKKLFFRIAKNGNVGIGLSYTTAPSYKLHINGTLHASDAVSFGSTLDVTGAITKPTTSGSNMTSNYISAGGGFSSGTGKYGVKILCCDQADAQTGLGQDLGGLTGGYELSVVGGTSSAGQGYISFVTHAVNSTSYRKLGYFYDNKGVISFDVLGTIHSTTGIWSDGYVSAKGQNTSSDMRLKNVLNDVVLGVKDIANAPSVRFAWKNGGGVDVGSSAQYWQGLLPDAVKERDGMLEMQYANIALLSAIAIAKNVETHEERIARLEKENKELRTKIDMMERGIA